MKQDEDGQRHKQTNSMHKNTKKIHTLITLNPRIGELITLNPRIGELITLNPRIGDNSSAHDDGDLAADEEAYQ